MANYQPLHRELYAMHAENFFVPSFLRAISENTEESFRSMIIEPSQGVYIFEMLQPRFCELLFDEVENFERWVHDTKFRIMRPNTMNKYGAVLDDFGMESMLDKLMNEFIRPMSKAVAVREERRMGRVLRLRTRVRGWLGARTSWLAGWLGAQVGWLASWLAGRGQAGWLVDWAHGQAGCPRARAVACGVLGCGCIQEMHDAI